MTLPETLILVLYFFVLSILAIYGWHRYYLVYLYMKNKDQAPGLPPPALADAAARHDSAADLQRDVRRRPADRRRLRDGLSARAARDSGPGRLDRRDDRRLPSWRCGAMPRAASTSRYLHRVDRTGYKAGALEAGLKEAQRRVHRDLRRRLHPAARLPAAHAAATSTDAKIGMVQARWGHINQDYSLLTKIQSILLDAHFVLEHGGRNRAGLLLQFQRHGRRVAPRGDRRSPAAGSTTR